MARITLNCTCSWTFFVPGTVQGHEVPCPSCGQAVRLPGRKPGQESKRAPGEIAAEQAGKQQLIWRIVGAAAVVVVAAGIYAAIPKSTPVEEKVVEKPSPFTTQPGSGTVTPKNEEANKAREAAAREERIKKISERGREQVTQINLGYLVAETFRLKGKPEESARVQADIDSYRGEIRIALAALQKENQLPNLDPVFEKGDVLVRLDKQTMTGMETADAARFLREWVRTWHTSHGDYDVAVQRSGKEVSFKMTFPKASQELFRLQRLLETLPPEPIPQAPEGVQVEAGLRKQYQDRMAALPAGYNRFIAPAELKRMDDLAKGTRGNDEDVEWFKVRAFEATLPTLEADAAAIKMKLNELQEKVKENTVPDAVVLGDGRRLEGKIIKEPNGGIRLKFALGSMVLSDVKELQPGKGAGSEYPARYEAAKGKVQALQELMAWCEKSKLTNERQYVAAQILTLDPHHDAARGVLKLPKPNPTAAPGAEK